MMIKLARALIIIIVILSVLYSLFPKGATIIVNFLIPFFRQLLKTNDGNFGDWLAFYGDLLATILTAIVAIFILRREFSNSLKAIGEEFRNSQKLQASEFAESRKSHLEELENSIRLQKEALSFQYLIEQKRIVIENYSSHVYIYEALSAFEEYIERINGLINGVRHLNLDEYDKLLPDQIAEIKTVAIRFLSMPKPRINPTQEDLRMLRVVDDEGILQSYIRTLSSIQNFYERIIIESQNCFKGSDVLIVKVIKDICDSPLRHSILESKDMINGLVDSAQKKMARLDQELLSKQTN